MRQGSAQALATPCLSCSTSPWASASDASTVVIWLTHMKTTVDIADPLLLRAKQVAALKKTTLKALIEDALRETLAKEDRAARPVELQTHTFRGRGLQPGLSWDDWSAVRDLVYEGRGA